MATVREESLPSNNAMSTDRKHNIETKMALDAGVVYAAQPPAANLHQYRGKIDSIVFQSKYLSPQRLKELADFLIEHIHMHPEVHQNLVNKVLEQGNICVEFDMHKNMIANGVCYLSERRIAINFELSNADILELCVIEFCNADNIPLFNIKVEDYKTASEFATAKEREEYNSIIRADDLNLKGFKQCGWGKLLSDSELKSKIPSLEFNQALTFEKYLENCHTSRKCYHGYSHFQIYVKAYKNYKLNSRFSLENVRLFSVQSSLSCKKLSLLDKLTELYKKKKQNSIDSQKVNSKLEAQKIDAEFYGLLLEEEKLLKQIADLDAQIKKINNDIEKLEMEHQKENKKIDDVLQAMLMRAEKCLWLMQFLDLETLDPSNLIVSSYMKDHKDPRLTQANLFILVRTQKLRLTWRTIAHLHPAQMHLLRDCILQNGVVYSPTKQAKLGDIDTAWFTPFHSISTDRTWEKRVSGSELLKILTTPIRELDRTNSDKKLTAEDNANLTRLNLSREQLAHSGQLQMLHFFEVQADGVVYSSLGGGITLTDLASPMFTRCHIAALSFGLLWKDIKDKSAVEVIAMMQTPCRTLVNNLRYATVATLKQTKNDLEDQEIENETLEDLKLSADKVSHFHRAQRILLDECSLRKDGVVYSPLGGGITLDDIDNDSFSPLHTLVLMCGLSIREVQGKSAAEVLDLLVTPCRVLMDRAYPGLNCFPDMDHTKDQRLHERPMTMMFDLYKVIDDIEEADSLEFHFDGAENNRSSRSYPM